MNAKENFAGVLIKIPGFMMDVYEAIALETQRELSDVISDDCNVICTRAFEQWRTNDERKDS